MTKFDAKWAAEEEAKRAYMAEHSLYRDEDEHSSCGVGLVVSIDGSKSRKVVEAGIDALKAIWHRGAVDADGKTGDGAGIHVQIPFAFFGDQIKRTGHLPREDEHLAVGQVFLPRTDFGAQETCRTIVETEVLRMGYYIYGWRHVPVDVSVLGEKANATRPERGKVTLKSFWETILETGHITAALLFLITAASMYARMLGIAGLPNELQSLLAENNFSFFWIMALMVVLMLFLGTILDTASIILIVVPLFLGLIETMGLSLVWFGIVAVVAAEIGLLTPPLGLSCFVIKATLDDDRIKLKDVFLGALPFAFVMLLVLIVLIRFPILSLALI